MEDGAMNRLLWFGGVAAAAGLLAASLAGGRNDGNDAARPALRRVLGPVASLAAGVEWIRVDIAIRRGEYARAYERAETALALDPEDPAGWIFLAHHLLYERASLSREPDREVRARWIRAGIETLERGERRSSDPGPVFFEHGLALAFQGSLADADRAWPGSAAEAWDLAARAFEAAAERGTSSASKAASLARERAAAIEHHRPETPGGAR
jgi:predicted Zn-dependent protease